MGKESKKGAAFYKSRGYEPVGFYLPKVKKVRFSRACDRDGRSLQKTLERMVDAFLKKAR